MLGEPMNADFPAAVCEMIVNQLRDRPSGEGTEAVEKARDARSVTPGLTPATGKQDRGLGLDLDATVEDPIPMDFSMNDDGASGIGGAASNNTLHDSLAQSEHDFDVPEIRAPDAKSIVTTSNLNSEDPSVSRNSTAAKLRDDGFTWRTDLLEVCDLLQLGTSSRCAGA